MHKYFIMDQFNPIVNTGDIEELHRVVLNTTTEQPSTGDMLII